ncbi:nucleoid-associated protein [Pseudomaricurvus alkylphenolicus]|jgi:nucleoid-associated protein|uniref:nucleoid-associated protein n=1 Tax=Pseudomaricurvus alkylphenolicus TaxID=1306991 RepID=UPI00141FF7AA|nr:nucleoid-associated protein [Pseudomaricurvus alkylphenolicus]NIB43734.1 nucleoid-associated protein [Pseudomaricurvus alkylphenolicus]
MPITECIAHAISRSGTEAPIELRLRENNLPVDGYLEEWVRDFKQAYIAKAGKEYGQFHPEAAKSQVAQWLREYRDKKFSFQRFSHKAMEHFQTLLQDTEVVIDGHLVFALEQLADADSLYIFLGLHSEGLYLDGDQNLQTSRYMDIKGLLLAAKIDLTTWQSDEEGSYLSVIRARGEKDLTDQFWNWLGFADQRDLAAETTSFLEAVSAFSETLEEEEVQVYRNKVVDYCLDQDKKGQAVVIRDLSEHIDDEKPDRFARFMEEKRSDTPPAIMPDRRQLKQYIRISGRNDLLSMSFAAECLGETIVYDKGEDSLIIKNIPAPLKLRLIKHLQQEIEAAEG